ncbi:MAG: GNAT family N-acetyltransferase, partial [Actinomycetota bacterium]|nr:GNAT family N-acetyltransferase [Actinomycetota bacterium]
MRIVELTDIPEHRVAETLLRESNPPGRPAPVTSDLMRALAHAGNYVAGAWDGSELAGIALAVHAADDASAPVLHAHTTVVAAGYRRRGIGAALMAHQRAWASARGLGTTTWLLDPLQRGAVAFSLGRLGAALRTYHCDFDGPGQDRCQVAWDLVRQPAHDTDRPTGEIPVALDRSPDGAPRLLGLPPRGPLR